MKATLLVNILESMGDAFVALDTEWRYTYMNQKAGQIFNRRPEDMIGKHIWTEFPEGIGQPFYKAYYKAVETQTSVYLEEYYPPYDRWFENRIYPSPDGLAIFFQDITDRKRAEQALRESEERLARIVETVPDGIAIVNREGQITFANAAAESILGLTRGGITDRAYDDPGWRITALDGSPFPQEELPFFRVKQSGQPVYGVEHAIEHPGGQRVILSINAAPLPEADGEFGGMAAAISDITERKRAEEALRESGEKFSVIFEKAAYAATLSRLPDGVFVDVNEAFVESFGFSRQEAVGKTSLELGFNPDAEGRARILAKLQARGSVRGLELALRTKSGEARDFAVNIDLVKIGGEQYILNTTQDVTERKRAEETLKRNEQTLRLFVEHSPAAIAMFDRDMNYIVASRRYLSDYDLGEQAVAGRSHYEIFPEIPERWKEIHRRCLAGATERADEDPFPRASGKLDWIRWEIRPWHERAGEIGGVILFSEVITERKQAQEALRESEERFSKAFHSNPAMLALSTLDGKNVDVNQAYADFLGYSREEILGKSVVDLQIVSLEERQKILDLIQRAEGSLRNAEVAVRVRDGSLRHILLSVDTISLGGVPHRLTTLLDITERKQAEAALRESERRFREMLADLQLIAVMLDVEGRVTFCNDYLLTLTGWQRDEALGQDWFAMFVPGERDDVRQTFLAALPTGDVSAHYENPILTRNGERRDILWNNTLLRDPAGNVVGTASIGEDITDRKRAEAERQRLAAIVEQSRDFIGIAALDHRGLYVNPGGSQLVGLGDPANVVNTRMEDYFTEETKRRMIEEIIPAMRSDGYWRGEVQFRQLATGRPIDVDFNLFFVKDPASGEPVCFATVSSDITERKLAERALLENRERLEFLSKQLLEAQETERRHIARELHDEIGQAFTALKLNLQSLERAPAAALGPQIQESIGIIEHAIQQVRNLSVELRPSLLDDLGLIPALRWHLDRYTQRTGTAVHFTADPATGRPPPEIETVCFRVTQEALTNVARHAQARQVWVDLRQSSDELRLTIRDDGQGFDVRAARSRAARGGSFGLLGMEERVLLIGGKIEIDSEPGRGTEIRVSFPLP